MLEMFRDRRGQVGETTTWIVATIIIIILLIIFVYISYALAKASGVIDYSTSVDVGGKSIKVDWISEKTNFAFEINEGSKNTIEAWIQNGEES